MYTDYQDDLIREYIKDVLEQYIYDIKTERQALLHIKNWKNKELFADCNRDRIKGKDRMVIRNFTNIQPFLKFALTTLKQLQEEHKDDLL